MEYKREVQKEIETGSDGNPVVDQIPVFENAIDIYDPFRIKMSPCTSQ
jgi:hypothetical protein